jgi:LysM repeat protein
MQLFTRKVTPIIFVLVLLFPMQSYAANFGVKPAYPRPDNPRTDSIFADTIEPGKTVNEGVKVINSTNEPKHLLLYAEDSVKSSGGGFACEQLGEESSDVGNWINFNLNDLTEDIERVRPGSDKDTVEINIPAGTEIIIPFTITAPLGVSVGEHNGCVLVQEIKEDTKETGVSLSLRSGLRVAITIPGEVVRGLTFSDFKIQRKGGSIYLMPSVENNGNVSIDTNVAVNVRYFFGLLHSRFGGQFPVLRDQIYDFNFELKKPFWGGLYMATAVFSYDKSDNAGIGITTGEELTKINSKTIWFFSFPTILGLVLEIIIILFLLFLLLIRRLRNQKKKWIRRWVKYTVAKDDTLEKISKENRIHWEILVEVNKMNPPYILKSGQEILIPPKRTLQKPVNK